MKHHFTIPLFAILLLLIALPVQAERLACTATYDNATGELNINAVSVGSNRYVVKLVLVPGGTTLRFRLDTATITPSHECYDAASVSATSLTIPDIAVADSFFNATLTLVSGSSIDWTTTPSTMQFDVTSSSKNPRLVPDAGLRVNNASNPFATVDSSGTTYLGYQDRNGHPPSFQSASDGLAFSTPIVLTYNNRSVDSRRTLMPYADDYTDDPVWRLYQLSQSGVMTSYISSDGNIFTPEAGIRYTAPESDNGTTGVYDLYVANDNDVVLVYVGDLMGKNNLRMAKSSDNGFTFTYVKGNVLGDDDAATTDGRSFIDNKTVLLADGRRRMFTMRAAELQSFITSDGYIWTREVGTRINYRDFASVGVTIYSLNDPVPVIDTHGNLKTYVAASTAPGSDEAPGNINWAIVSATWNDNYGSGVLGTSGVCGASNGLMFTSAPSSELCSNGAASAVTGSSSWNWTCHGINGGSDSPACSALLGYTVSVTLAGTGSGSVNSNPSGISCTSGTCNASFSSGTSATLTATPSTGSTFYGWSGDCSGNGDCTLTMNAAKNVTATFPSLNYVRILGTSYGSITSAHSAAAADSVIQAQAVTFTGAHSLSKGLTLRGGYDSTFSEDTRTGYTTIDGTVTISGSGKVIMDRVIIN